MINMSKRTVKVGSSGRFGARYGVIVRNSIKTVEADQKADHECPVCHHMAVGRVSSGIWSCRHCGVKFAAKAYSPVSKREISQVSES